MYLCAMLEDKNPAHTSLDQLGEFQLIEKLTHSFALQNPSSLEGIGDDAAVCDFSSGHTVLTTDLLVEGIHFDLSYMPLKHLGYKSVVVNLSDVYAMNAKPAQITVSLAVSNRFSLEALEELYAGIRLACQNYKVDLVGGDTTSSTTGLILSITATGQAAAEKSYDAMELKPTICLLSVVIWAEPTQVCKFWNAKKPFLRSIRSHNLI